MQLGNYPIAMILRPFTSALFSLRLQMISLTESLKAKEAFSIYGNL